MNNYLASFNFLMTSEDPLLKYESVRDPVQPRITPAMTAEEESAEQQRAANARAISGVNSYFFPQDFANINAEAQSNRGPMIQSFYQQNFWNKWLAQIESDDLTMRIFDSGVNQGGGTAARILQNAVNAISSQSLTVDGGWGPLTLDAVNRCAAGTLLAAFKAARADKYRDIAANNPNAPLSAWLARAGK